MPNDIEEAVVPGERVPSEAPRKVDAIVDAWFADHFVGGHRLVRTTEDWNDLVAAREDLKNRLA